MKPRARLVAMLAMLEGTRFEGIAAWLIEREARRLERPKRQERPAPLDMYGIGIAGAIIQAVHAKHATRKAEAGQAQAVQQRYENAKRIQQVIVPEPSSSGELDFYLVCGMIAVTSLASYFVIGP